MHRDRLVAMTFVVLSLIAVMAACSRQDKDQDGKLLSDSMHTEAERPLASFERMVGGEWKMTAEAGTSMSDTWRWGPGHRSLRVMTDGEDAQGNLWRAMQAVYWHPGRKQVCLWGVNPFRGSVEEGTIKFDRETAEAVYDLYQPGDRRKVVRRWEFSGRDRYRSALFEEIEPGRVVKLVEFNYSRTTERVPADRSSVEKLPEFPEELGAIESFVERAWETDGAAKGIWAHPADVRLRSVIEWIPYANGVYARVEATGSDGAVAHVLDVYVYRHTGAGVLRCLALSKDGWVYDGEVRVIAGGGLRIPMKVYEGDRVASIEVLIDREADGRVHQRVWRLGENERDRTLMLDVHHKPVEAKRSTVP